MKAVIVLQSRVRHEQIVGYFLQVRSRDLERAGSVDLRQPPGDRAERRPQRRIRFHDQEAWVRGDRTQDFMVPVTNDSTEGASYAKS
jgi:hypothetical protein